MKKFLLTLPTVVLCLSVLLGLGVNAHYSLGKPYEPLADSVTLLTEVQDGSYSSNLAASNYIVSKTHTAKGATLLFYKGVDIGTGLPVCTVTVKDNGDISFSSTSLKQVKEASDFFFLYPGFPVPVDVLPINRKVDEKEFIVKRTAGGRTFINKFHVETHTLSPEKVREQKWLRANIDGPEKFQLIAVYDAAGRLVAQQLWQDGDDWWLYSETQFRRSWRVD